MTCHPDCSVCIYAVWSLDGDDNVVMCDELEQVMNPPGNSLCAVLASLKGAWQVKSAGLSLTTGVARRNRSRWTSVTQVRCDLDLDGTPRRGQLPNGGKGRHTKGLNAESEVAFRISAKDACGDHDSGDV